ncbi:hypothetical protein [Paenibacillus arenosi]|uniref:Cell surface protein n=1 Tax=Paenibacillus arenosi TaxID=2774142 RepID=A0ABR9B322_9BACL|nr:hypothetical protein [Paenibacillus arenosi]MBD8500314.1 hypothetical protein [Paenibacillus arenosi]
MMVMKPKKWLAHLLLIAALSMLLAGCTSNEQETSSSNLPIHHLHGTFSIDVHDPKAVVGDADYVFVGRVDKLVNTEYKNAVTLETETGTKEVASPYTNYSITILENLKGELQTGVSNPVQKSGGVNEDGASIVLYEEDILPQVDNVYIFVAYAQKDGSLLVSGPNSTIAVPANGTMSETNLARVAETNEYQTYSNAVNNEKDSVRERFVSKFDTQNK